MRHTARVLAVSLPVRVVARLLDACLLLALVASCGGSAPAPAETPAAAMPAGEVLALSGGTLIDGTGAPPVQDAILLIQGSRIVAAGPRGAVAIPDGARVVDVTGGTILPGFINAHVHGGFDASTLAAWAQGGVTTVRDLATRPANVDWDLRDASRSRPELARLVAAGPMVTVPDGYPIAQWGVPSLTVTSPDDARQKVAELLGQGADLVKLALESGTLFGQRMPMLTLEEAAAAAQVAHAAGRPVSAHVTVATDLTRALDAGVDDIAHMVTDPVPDEAIRRMVEKGVYWVPTLELWQGVGLRRQAIRDNLSRFVAAGGRVALGTDYQGAPDVEFDLGMPITEIELMAQAGMTPMQIIVAATAGAAHVCGLDGELGTLEPGKLADVLVVDGNPLGDPSAGSGESLRALTQIRLVLRSGVIIRQSP